MQAARETRFRSFFPAKAGEGKTGGLPGGEHESIILKERVEKSGLI
jgi:hypothetical protein